MPGPLDLDDLLDLAVRIGEQAAALLVDGLDRVRSIDTKSTPTDPVTEMDHASERLIAGALADARPDDGFLGEEGTGRPTRSGIEWVVDPIDGTVNYVYGLPGFAVSIAAVREGHTLVGAVFDPLRGSTYTAIAGRGARRNGQPIACSSVTRLSDTLVATGFSYEPERRRRQALVLTEVLPAVRDIRRLGSASVDLCLVGSGRVDAYYEKGLHAWDYSAGELVAREAGARTGNLDGGPLDTSFALASAPAVFDELADLLRRSGAGGA